MAQKAHNVKLSLISQNFNLSLELEHFKRTVLQKFQNCTREDTRKMHFNKIKYHRFYFDDHIRILQYFYLFT